MEINKKRKIYEKAILVNTQNLIFHAQENENNSIQYSLLFEFIIIKISCLLLLIYIYVLFPILSYDTATLL